MHLVSDPNLIAGIERSEDAGVYKLTDELAIIQTMDFFTPIVDDPYAFGQIAVANALSDVYAMGGKALIAMNIVCFPEKTLGISVLKDVLAGGLDKMHEAGVLLVGGHSVEDQELKYGLSVTGIVHPAKVVLNNGAIAGDRIILTKPLGTGILSTAIKGNMVDEKVVDKVTRSMSALNRKASELMLEAGVHACTDITGFGLLGHAAEMIEGTDVGMVIHAAEVPYLSEAREFAEMGMLPGGLHRNRDYRKNMVEMGSGVPAYLADILFDPQTSGGLLISLPEPGARQLLDKMHREGVAEAAVIGEVIGKPEGKIIVD